MSSRVHEPIMMFACFALFLATASAQEELTLHVNTKKAIAVTSDEFLSLTVEPHALLDYDDAQTNYRKSVNLAKALKPAYVRLAGPESNFYYQQRQQRNLNDGDSNNEKMENNYYPFSESNWQKLRRWTEKSGLKAIISVAPELMENGETDVISLSDKMAFNASWQLGYECQRRCEFTASDIAKRVLRLRNELHLFPRYSASMIIGPDIVAYGTKEEQRYVRDYLEEVDSALSAITWHPNFTGVTLSEDGVFMSHGRLQADKEGLYKAIGQNLQKRPLWIAESTEETCKNEFLGALVWADRLGSAAKIGAQVIMRQPTNLSEATPDYWVSLLHKNFVGPEVLEARIPNGNKSHVHFYCQCSKASTRYEKGSITIFGINLMDSKVKVNLKGIKARVLHRYVLMPGFDATNRMFAEKVLLNDQPLDLINNEEIPSINPVILYDEEGLSIELPAGGIGFWVVPDQKFKSCVEKGEATNGKTSLKKVLKDLGDTESTEIEVPRTDERRGSARYAKRNRKNVKKWMKLEVQEDKEKFERKLKKINMQKEFEGSGESSKRKFLRREDQSAMSISNSGNTRNTSSNSNSSGGGGASESLNLFDIRSRDGQRDDFEESRERPEKLKSKQEEPPKDVEKEKDEQKEEKVLEEGRLERNKIRRQKGERNFDERRKDTLALEGGNEAGRSKRDLDEIYARHEWRDYSKRRANGDERSHFGERSKERGILSAQAKATESSEENHFYGFSVEEAAQDFPRGDVFLSESDESAHDGNDGNYFARNDDGDSGEEQAHSRYVANEFFGKMQRSPVETDERRENREELWEANSSERKFRYKDSAVMKIPREEKEKDGKANIAKRIAINRETNFEGNGGTGNFAGARVIRPTIISLSKIRQQAMARRASLNRKNEQKIPMNQMKGQTVLIDEDELADLGLLRLAESPKSEISQKLRTKRDANELNLIFEREMMNEDNHNFRDCRCRVIRDLNDESQSEDKKRDYVEEIETTEAIKGIFAPFEVDYQTHTSQTMEGEAANVDENPINLINEEFQQENYEEFPFFRNSNSTNATEESATATNVSNSSKEPSSSFVGADSPSAATTVATEDVVETSTKYDFFLGVTGKSEEEIPTIGTAENFEDGYSQNLGTTESVAEDDRLFTKQEKRSVRPEEGESEIEETENQTTTEKENFIDDYLEKLGTTESILEEDRQFTKQEKRSVGPEEGESEIEETENQSTTEKGNFVDDYSENFGTTQSILKEDRQFTKQEKRSVGPEESESEIEETENQTTTEKENFIEIAETTPLPREAIQQQQEQEQQKEEQNENQKEEQEETKEGTTEPEIVTTTAATPELSKREISRKNRITKDLEETAKNAESLEEETQKSTIINKKFTNDDGKSMKKSISKTANPPKMKMRSKTRAEEAAKARGARLNSRIEALLALSKDYDGRRGKRVMENAAARPPFRETDKYKEYQRRRLEQLEGLRQRLLARKQRMLQQYEDELLHTLKRGETNDEKRKLKREVWKKLKNDEDFHHLQDEEKLAYILLGGAIDRQDSGDKRNYENEREEKYVPIVEITRPLSKVQARITEPRRYYGTFQDPRVTRYDGSEETISKLLRPKYVDVVGEGEKYTDDKRGSGKNYLVFVDDPENYWMLQYRRREEENRKSIYENPTILEPIGTDPLEQRKGYVYRKEQEKILDEDKNEESTNSRSPKRKIYVLDPSTYRGGEPDLKIQEDSPELVADNVESQLQPIYRLILNPKSKKPLEKNYSSRNNAPTLYILDAKRQHDSRKTSTNPLDRRHANIAEKEDEMKIKEEDLEEPETSNNCKADGIEIIKSTCSSKMNESPNIDESSDDEEKLERVEQAAREFPEKVRRNGETESDGYEENTGEKENKRRTRRGVTEVIEPKFFKKLPIFLMRKVPLDQKQKIKSKETDYLILQDDSNESFSKIEPSNAKSFEKYFNAKNGDKKYKKLLGKTHENWNANANDYSDEFIAQEILKTLLPPLSQEESVEQSRDYSQEIKNYSAESEDYLETDEVFPESNKDDDLNANIGYKLLRIIPSNMRKYIRERRQLRNAETEDNSNDNEIRSIRRQETNEIPQNIHGNIIYNNFQGKLKAPHKANTKIQKEFKSPETLMKAKQEFLDYELPIADNDDYLNNFLDKDQPQNFENTKESNRKELENNDLPSFLEGTIPKLEQVITGEVGKVQNLSESIEGYVGDFDRKFNESLMMNNETETLRNATSNSITRNIFQTATLNIKKLFSFLGGIMRIFYKN